MKGQGRSLRLEQREQVRLRASAAA
jgi:hypothetical protein